MNARQANLGRDSDHGTVAAVMHTTPTLHPPSTTRAQLRAFLDDIHVHAALIVSRGRLVTVIERNDLTAVNDPDDRRPVACLGTLTGRVVRDSTPLVVADRILNSTGRRRLAVSTITAAASGFFASSAAVPVSAPTTT